MRHSILTLLLATALVQAQDKKEDDKKRLPGSIWSRTAGPDRDKLLRAEGGTAESEAAVAKGLKWLSRMQQADGRWELDDARFKDAGTHNDVAATAFGLLPFLGAGHSHKNMESPFRALVGKGLVFLLRQQDNKSGMMDPNMYAHALATLALCEAYALTSDPTLKTPAQRAVDYLIFAQHDLGGWRYGPKQAGDTSVTGWVVQALKAGQQAGLDVPAAATKRVSTFLDSVCSVDEGYGYTSPASGATLTAVGLWCRQQLDGWGPRNPRFVKATAILEREPPAPKTMYYGYYATQVLFHSGGPAWEKWNKKMRAGLIAAQVKAGAMEGSWSAAAGHAVAGRLMQTSLCLLTLEVYYRQTPLFRK